MRNHDGSVPELEVRFGREAGFRLGFHVDSRSDFEVSVFRDFWRDFYFQVLLTFMGREAEKQVARNEQDE